MEWVGKGLLFILGMKFRETIRGWYNIKGGTGEDCMLGMIRLTRVGVTLYRLGNPKLMTPLPHAILTRASCPPHAAVVYPLGDANRYSGAKA